MNLGELQTALGELLRVQLKRYPLSKRTEHLNQAIKSIQQEFDSQYGEDIQTWNTVASQGEYPIDTYFADPAPLFQSPIHVYYVNSEGAEVVVEQRTYEEVSKEWPIGSDEGDPTVFCIFQREIMLRPVPDGVITLYWAFQGYTRPLADSTDSNDWTEKMPTLILYRAAEYATVWLLEDDRVGFFQTLSERELVREIANDGMRDTARRPESEEPG